MMVVKKFGFESQVAGKGIDQGAVVAAVDGRRVDHDGFLKAVTEAAASCCSSDAIVALRLGDVAFTGCGTGDNF